MRDGYLICRKCLLYAVPYKVHDFNISLFLSISHYIHIYILLSDSANAVDECYQQNRFGNILGHCGINFLYPIYKQCFANNYKCGLLHCEGGSFLIGSVNEPVYHNSIQVMDGDGVIHTCLSFTTLLNSSRKSQPTLLHRGTPCGKDMVCMMYICYRNSVYLVIS